jgi:hypothetical protein
MPALLFEGVRADARVEHGVEIDIDQVVEILQILARDRVTGLVGIGECVEEGVERALHQLDERVLDGIFARSAQHRMLEDVCNARRVRGHRAERHPEHLVLVAVDEREELRAGLGMAIEPCGGVELGQRLFAQQFETVGSRHQVPQEVAHKFCNVGIGGLPGKGAEFDRWTVSCCC